MARTQENKAGIKLQAGTTAPYTGYLFTEENTREIAQGWQNAESQLKIITRAYDDLKRESLESAHELNKEIERLNAAILEDAKRARRVKRRKTFWNLTGGFIFGTAVGMIIHNNR